MALTVSPWTVFLTALITAIATGLGALPLLLMRDIGRRWLGLFFAVAAGLMLAASHGLMAEGSALDPWRTIAGLLGGAVLIALARRWAGGHGRADFGVLHGADAQTALLFVGVMTLHSIAEGVGLGVAYGGGEELGLFITLAIAVQNIPEGLAIGLVLVPRGVSVVTAAGWSIVSSLPQPLLALPAYLSVSLFEPLLPVGLGLAAGAMIWMVFAELVPDALEATPPRTVATVLLVALGAMLALQEAMAG